MRQRDVQKKHLEAGRLKARAEKLVVLHVEGDREAHVKARGKGAPRQSLVLPSKMNDPSVSSFTADSRQSYFLTTETMLLF